MSSPTVTSPSTGPVRIAADVLVHALAEHDVDFIFLNPGTDTAPVQEALARCAAAGTPAPRVVMCPHEAVALAAAHGYFARTGRPQVVMVHVDVGTQNMGSMLHNAFRGEAGVLIIAGRTPVTSHGEQPGGRDLVVHWHQDVPDQAGTVRSYVKWSGEVLGADTLSRQVARAFQVAASSPPGPAYLMAAREVLMQPAARTATPPEPGRLGPPAPCAPDPQMLQTAAHVLAHAENPVIATSRVGRHPAAVAELAKLAELLGAPVLDRRERLNLPTTHPSYLADGADTQTVLGKADALLVVDSDVPWVPLRIAPNREATVIQMDADPARATMPGWDFVADLRLRSDPHLGLRLLNDQLTELRDADLDQRWQRRRAELTARRNDQAVRRCADHGELCVAAVAETLNDFLADDDIVIEEAVTNAETLRQHLRRTRPATLFQSGGSGLGWGVPAAVGAKLAAPGRRVVAIVGDGSLLFANPVASLMTALQAGAPVLLVVLQNGGYAASSRPVLKLFPDGTSERSGEVIGTRFTSMPDLAMLAQACHAHGEHVHDPAAMSAAVQRAFAAVTSGRSAVIVAHVSSPWLARGGLQPSTALRTPPTGGSDDR